MPSSIIQVLHSIGNKYKNSTITASAPQATEMLYKACFPRLFFCENSSGCFFKLKHPEQDPGTLTISSKLDSVNQSSTE